MNASRWAVLVLLTTIWGCASAPLPRVGPAVRSPAGRAALPLTGPINTVVIDAGHGGRDPGTSHFGLKEKQLALDIAKRLRAQLQNAGLTAVMTRETDQFIPLPRRPDIANRLGADLFVSVHINANNNRRVSGAEVYYPRVSEVSSSAHWPPTVSSAEVGVPSITVKQILWDLVLSRTRWQSRHLASSICRSMRGEFAPCQVVKPARFVVLREAWMPAVLVEVGYVSNRTEAQRLGNAEYRQAAAESIANGILSYIRSMGAQDI